MSVAASQPVLQISGLTKSYRRVTALRDVTLEVRAGEILGLIGPNGSGKTTLLECAAGVLDADEGSVRSASPLDRSRSLFYLADAITPWPAQTVRWALDFTAGFFEGTASPSTRVRLIGRLDLEPLLDSTIGSLSKGQRKRALLALALLMPHALLLLDEPFDGLDLRQTRDVAALLRDEARAGRTLFLSIHQISEAARVCDRFVLLSLGRVRGAGTLEELAASLPASASADARLDLEQVFLALT
jgi:ABC-type multidrug transport system ATPase subunit